MRPVNREIVGECRVSSVLPVTPVHTVVEVRMMLLTGQPLLQNGVPQSMQRAPRIFAPASAAEPMTNSLEVSSGVRRPGVAALPGACTHETGGLFNP